LKRVPPRVLIPGACGAVSALTPLRRRGVQICLASKVRPEEVKRVYASKKVKGGLQRSPRYRGAREG
jgi:hypothetical protein